MIFDMALNQAVILPPLMQQIWDKTLNVPLAGGFVNFYHDNARTTPKDVYELVGTGPGSYTYVSLGSVLQLSGIGTYIDSSGGNIPIYLWPFSGSPNDQPPSTTADNYYVTVYSLTGVFQFDIPNWPGVASGGGGGGATSTSDNIISNGQFVDVDFPVTATSSTPQTFTIASGTVTTEIAPDWSVITTGAGTVNVWQIPISGATTNIGNPAYALGISTTGFSLPIQLTQTIQAPRILASTPVSATFIAQSNGANVTLSMTYTPSITGAPQTLASGTAVSADYSVIANATPISITNPGVGTGSVNVSIVIPNGTSVNISCVQLCAAINNAIVGYIQETPEREVDHLFHYFQPAINFKPIPSLLVGWDFAVNPKQFGVTSFTNSPQYVWDQTICSSVVGTINVSQGPQGSFAVATNNANEAFYMLQYLTTPESLETALSRLSVNLNAICTNHNDVIARVYLYYGNASSSIPILPTTIGTIAANGVFTLTAANWSQINQGLAFSNQTTLTQTFDDHGFSSFDNTANIGNVKNFAIVVTFSCPTSGSIVGVQSISCVPGDIPTRPAPMSYVDTLANCQYYYEDSRLYGATLYPMDSVAVPTAGSPFAETFASGFNIKFETLKRTLPAYTIFSFVPTQDMVTVFLYYADGTDHLTFINPDVAITIWVNTVLNKDGMIFQPVTIMGMPGSVTPIAQVVNGIAGKTVSADLYNCYSAIGLYYIADARLGVV